MGTRAGETVTTRDLRSLGRLYEEARARITALVEDLEDPHSIALPACPEWSVHDVVSHMTGACVDTANGRLDGLGSSLWTDVQVQDRRERSTGEVLEEWAEVTPGFAAALDDFPGRYGQMPIADVTSHEHDIRGALQLPGDRSSYRVALATDFLMTVFVHTAADAFGLGPLEVRAGDRNWVIGTGGPPTGDTEAWLGAAGVSGEIPEPRAAVVGRVEADAFEWYRAASGRRSESQIRRFNWSVDPQPYLRIFSYGFFTMRDSDLDE